MHSLILLKNKKNMENNLLLHISKKSTLYDIDFLLGVNLNNLETPKKTNVTVKSKKTKILYYLTNILIN